MNNKKKSKVDKTIPTSLFSQQVHNILINIDVKDQDESGNVKDKDSLRRQG